MKEEINQPYGREWLQEEILNLMRDRDLVITKRLKGDAKLLAQDIADLSKKLNLKKKK